MCKHFWTVGTFSRNTEIADLLAVDYLRYQARYGKIRYKIPFRHKWSGVILYPDHLPPVGYRRFWEVQKSPSYFFLSYHLLFLTAK